jgi:hypothetical protein
MTSNPPTNPEEDSTESVRKCSDRLYYVGPSMTPTMKAGDLLLVVPYRDRSIRIGDVIVFKPRGKCETITHRVVSVGPSGVRTRGDHNNQIDPWLLARDEIIGRVTHVQRGPRERPLPGSSAGRVYAAVLRLRSRGAGPLVALLRPLYRGLARTGVVQRVLFSRVSLQRVTFARPGGAAVKLLLGNREIGRLLPGNRGWLIRPPYRLLVDEKRFPRARVTSARCRELGK